jgi:hypothetical protein
MAMGVVRGHGDHTFLVNGQTSPTVPSGVLTFCIVNCGHRTLWRRMHAHREGEFYQGELSSGGTLALDRDRPTAL